MHREDRAVDGVDVLELLADQSQRQIVQAMAAVALREADARQADRRELGEDLGVMPDRAVVGRDARRELAAAEVAHRLHELLLVRSQRQVKHRCLTYLVGEGLGAQLGVGLGLALGEGVLDGLGALVGLGVGHGVGLGDGAGCRSFGPTCPIRGRCWPMLRMIGTEREVCSCGSRKPV